MNDQATEDAGERIAALIGGLALLGIVAVYVGLSLVALYKPLALPANSIFQASLIGPPALLGSAAGSTSLYWACTIALAALMAAGATFLKLRLIAALLFIALWMAAGFLPVLMSV